MARPSTTVQAISDFIAGCKTDGVWSKITEAYLMAGVTFGGITVKLKGTGTLTNNNFVSGDYQATGTGAGLSGDGSTKYIDTGLNSSVLTKNNTHLSLYAENIFRYGTVVELDAFRILSASNIFYSDQYNSVDGRNSSSYTNDGMFIGSRTSSISHKLYLNGLILSENSNSGGNLPNSNFLIFYDGFNFSDGSIRFASCGTGLTDTDASNLTNRIETLMDALGCGVIS